jgi:hypothetical protein
LGREILREVMRRRPPEGEQDLGDPIPSGPAPAADFGGFVHQGFELTPEQKAWFDSFELRGLAWPGRSPAWSPVVDPISGAMMVELWRGRPGQLWSYALLWGSDLVVFDVRPGHELIPGHSAEGTLDVLGVLPKDSPLLSRPGAWRLSRQALTAAIGGGTVDRLVGVRLGGPLGPRLLDAPQEPGASYLAPTLGSGPPCPQLACTALDHLAKAPHLERRLPPPDSSVDCGGFVRRDLTRDEVDQIGRLAPVSPLTGDLLSITSGATNSKIDAVLYERSNWLHPAGGVPERWALYWDGEVLEFGGLSQHGEETLRTNGLNVQVRLDKAWPDDSPAWARPGVYHVIRQAFTAYEKWADESLLSIHFSGRFGQYIEEAR